MSTPMNDDLADLEQRSGGSPRTVRQLKPPPEIWELVHPVQERQFKPGRALAMRIIPKWTTLVLVAFGVGLISGVAAAVWKRPEVKSFLSESFKSEPSSPVEKAKVKAEPTKPVQNAPVVAPVATTKTGPPEQPAVQSDPVATTAPEVTNPIETEAEAQMATIAKANKPAIRKTSAKPKTGSTGVDTATGDRVSARANQSDSQPAKSSERGTQSSPVSGPTQEKAGASSSQQVITPAKTPPGPKAKVIDWP